MDISRNSLMTSASRLTAFTPQNRVQQTMVRILPEMLSESESKIELFQPEYLGKFHPNAVAVTPGDPRLVITPQEEAAQAKANAAQVKANPHLELVLSDPRAFKKDLEARFEKQKALTPEDPYQFDVADYGIPVMKDLDALYTQEIDTLNKKLGHSVEGQAEKTGIKAALAAAGNMINPFHWMADKNKELGLVFLKDLQKEVRGHIESDSISYRRLQELGQFSATALGHFDDEDLGLLDRSMLVVDRYLLGKESGNIEEEYRRYKDDDFKLFRKDAGDSGIARAEKTFETGLFNPDKLEFVSLPTARSLGPGVFMNLLPHDVFLMGITPEPEAADGFKRPGGDFYLHDNRHASSIFTKRKIYEKEHNVSPAQKQKLEALQTVWKAEMVDEKKKIESKELRYAIGFFGFNHHHDRGVPQLPSSFLADKPGWVARALQLALKISGQPTGFENPKQTINEAYNWLQKFWLERLPQEEAVLAASDPELSKILVGQVEAAAAALPQPARETNAPATLQA